MQDRIDTRNVTVVELIVNTVFAFHGQDVRQKKTFEIQVKPGREISDAEIETLSYLLFRWWKREFEQRRVEVIERGNQKE